MSEDLNTAQVGFPADSGFTPPAEPTGQPESPSADNLNLEGNVTGSEASSPETLAEEYKPYSQFAWHEIPEEARPGFLEKLKKFHGDMTKGSQEAASLRTQVDEYRQKAQWFDGLASERWFQDAYSSRNQAGPTNQAPAPQQGAPIQGLEEYGLEQGATQAIQQAISSGVNEAVGPLAQELSNVRRQMLTEQTERDMADLRVTAQSKGWPSPDDKLSDISKLIQDGRARSLKDAYRLSVFEEVPNLTANQARLAVEQELRSKAEQTISPAFSPPEMPGEQVFTGENAVLEALNQSIAEIGARQKASGR